MDCRDPSRLAAFWCEVLGFVELERAQGSVEIGPPGERPVSVGQNGDEGWHVLADPEGNEFCLLRNQLRGYDVTMANIDPLLERARPAPGRS